ncbi:hypothetical protein N2W42_000003 [Clostridium perfringens]|uniref:hypothetical protein n=1 Tax=Clostridium perfringens TaxID=1502 RepID=UPI0028530A07|nr:hypothetical protein [Clostridium perfringens]EJT6339283.1 hypothetical protein [Clostridium perfringens]CAJ1610869.1 hypothetical protein CLO5623_02341 [Clostridium perfringens]
MEMEIILSDYIEIDLFENDINGILNDFYFKTKNHMFNTCMSIIRDKELIDERKIGGTLNDFCSIIFKYTLENLFWISEKGLWYPSKIYSGYIYVAETKGQLLFVLKSIKIILDIYDKLKYMTREQIENSEYCKYIYE